MNSAYLQSRKKLQYLMTLIKNKMKTQELIKMSLATIRILAVATAIVMAMLFYGSKTALGSAPPGLPATVATSTFRGVTAATVNLLFATSSCAARVITTTGTDVRLTFSDWNGQRPTNVNGHLQLASTTETYDSGQFGCGAVYVFPLGTQTMSLTESR